MDVDLAQSTPRDEHEALALERAALARWCRGDPGGFVEISDDEVSYFDPFVARRIDGRTALAAYYAGLAGQISEIAWEVIDPMVTDIGDVAILSYRCRSWGERGAMVSWNCTEVFRRRPEGLRLIHTHWSLTAPTEAA